MKTVMNLHLSLEVVRQIGVSGVFGIEAHMKRSIIIGYSLGNALNTPLVCYQFPAAV
jgi:hypothetical protein